MTAIAGRAVTGEEAFTMGLVNRVAPSGGGLAAAVALAQELAALPQTCLRHDRLSAIEQWDLAEADAVVNELRHGRATIESGEPRAGALRFAAGFGRHGEPAPSD